jgi:predicted 2-oxoglutarate/Fe(II)-dependent dioxygenase YbiX
MDIKKIYNCENVKFSINDIFISKYTKEKINETQSKDSSFLTLNIQLNDEIDYIGGEIIFSDYPHEKMIIHQGDMIIYNGNKLRTKGGVSDGVKYVLVLIIEIFL